MSPSALSQVTELDREGIRAFLPTLDAWLLPGALFSVHHTWPQLYRSDGRGRFFAVLDGERLVSHCATRRATLVGAEGPVEVALLGSVATDPAHRGRGLAGQVLERAVAAATADCAHVLLWAERPELYARHGFAPGPAERCLLLARRPHPDLAGVRRAEVRDHAAIWQLHCDKPWRVERTRGETSGLLTTPGLLTLVRERGGEIVAYACCGKGADLAGHWHEVGGDDAEVAALLQAALHVAGQTEAVLLLPPYRAGLRAALGGSVVGECEISGPMAYSTRGPLPACWVDGLDSV